MLDVRETDIPGLLVLTPRRFGDARGWFEECWNAERWAAAGIADAFVQDNHSLSAAPGTLRGLHFQAPPHSQGKLVRCGRGRLWDVAVDIRRGSPTYGRHMGLELSAENGVQLWIPEGFAHGFVTREADTEIVYKCTGYYAPEADGGVAWDSAGIDWGLEGAAPVLSEKDAALPALDGFDSPFAWEGRA
jgi:dTDP-4-dehydrorhamnose 3,5-epimerase